MIAWPLDNKSYTAEAIGAWSGTRTRGVFSADDCFTVTAAGGFGIKISGGLAWLKVAAYWGIAVYEKMDTVKQIDVGSGLLPRYVAVVVQYSKTDNEVRTILRYSDYSDAPEMPQPVQNEYYDEIIPAVVLQRPAAVEITQADITDTRLDETMCGLMRDGVTGIPTAQLEAQWSAWRAQQTAETNAWQQAEKQAFDAWFARIKGKLDGDAAGHLQQQVDAVVEADAAHAAEVQVFAATLLADGWVEEPQTPESGSETEPAAEGDGTDTTGEGEEPPAAPALAVYTQTVPCAGLLAAYDLEAPQVESTGEYAADLARKEALDALCEAGNCGETLDGQLRWICYGGHPTVDLPLRLRRAVVPEAAGGAGSGPDAEEVAGNG